MREEDFFSFMYGIRELVLNIYIYLRTEGEGRRWLGYISHREKKKALCLLGRVL